MCGPLFFPFFKSHPTLPLCGPILSVLFSKFLWLGLKRYRIVREPIFISAFLFSTQTQVTRFIFHLWSHVYSFPATRSNMFISTIGYFCSSWRLHSFLIKCHTCLKRSLLRFMSLCVFKQLGVTLILPAGRPTTCCSCHWTLLFSLCVIVVFRTPGGGHGYCSNGYILHGFGLGFFGWSSQKYMPTATCKVCHLPDTHTWFHF